MDRFNRDEIYEDRVPSICATDEAHGRHQDPDLFDRLPLSWVAACGQRHSERDGAMLGRVRVIGGLDADGSVAPAARAALGLA